jgi:hypothetical protein
VYSKGRAISIAITALRRIPEAHRQERLCHPVCHQFATPVAEAMLGIQRAWADQRCRSWLRMRNEPKLQPAQSLYLPGEPYRRTYPDFR